jgi:hypothetical protein
LLRLLHDDEYWRVKRKVIQVICFVDRAGICWHDLSDFFYTLNRRPKGVEEVYAEIDSRKLLLRYAGLFPSDVSEAFLKKQTTLPNVEKVLNGWNPEILDFVRIDSGYTKEMILTDMMGHAHEGLVLQSVDKHGTRVRACFEGILKALEGETENIDAEIKALLEERGREFLLRYAIDLTGSMAIVETVQSSSLVRYLDTASGGPGFKEFNRIAYTYTERLLPFL